MKANRIQRAAGRLMIACFAGCYLITLVCIIGNVPTVRHKSPRTAAAIQAANEPDEHARIQESRNKSAEAIRQATAEYEQVNRDADEATEQILELIRNM